MARQSARMKELQRELSKAVHAVNEKIRYHETRGTVYADVMPARESAREIKKYAQTPRDLQREIKRLRAFGTPDAQTPIQVSERLTITKWEKEQTAQAYRTMNTKRTIERKFYEDLDATSRGKKLGEKAGKLLDDRIAELQPKKLNWNAIRSRSELQEKIMLARKQETKNYFKQKQEQFKTNYIKAITNQFGKEQAAELINKLEKMKAKDVIKKYYTDKEADFTFMYKDPLSNVEKIDALEMTWDVKPFDAGNLPNFLDELDSGEYEEG